MAKGLRFFGEDFNEASFNNAVTVTNADGNKDFMFDNDLSTKWLSDGTPTNGNAVSIIVNFGSPVIIDALFVQDTNIDDIELQYNDGAIWTTLSGSVATVTKSADFKNVFVKANNTITAAQVKIVGTNTIVANQEKYVSLFNAFLEIGQLEYFPGFAPKNVSFQNKYKTTNGKNITIERGQSFEAEIKFKSHVNQNDIDLAETLIDRREPFFIWPCGGDTSIFSFAFYPFKFKHIFKVTIQGNNSPALTKNYYKAGYNNILKLVEAA